MTTDAAPGEREGEPAEPAPFPAEQEGEPAPAAAAPAPGSEPIPLPPVPASAEREGERAPHAAGPVPGAVPVPAGREGEPAPHAAQRPVADRAPTERAPIPAVPGPAERAPNAGPGEREGEPPVVEPAPSEPADPPAEPAGAAPLNPWRRSGRPGVELRRRRLVVLLCMAIATASGVLLAMAGVSMVRDSTVGRYEQALGPDEPGYQALVVPTPTMAVVHRGADGTLAGVSLLSLEPEDRGGSVVMVPPSLVAQNDPNLTTTLADVYATDGAAGVTSALGRVLAVAIGDRVEVDDGDWARLVGPVGPVELTLDNAVTGWAAGPVDLEPADVGRFLSARDPDETDLDRLERQEQFWTAWLQQVSQGGEDAVPGDVEVGVGRFVRGIAAETVLTQALPVQRDEQADGLHLRPNGGRVASLLAQAVPFPTGPEAGARIKVRLLNGTDDRALTTEAATSLVGGGAEIDIVGNAASFDVPETTVSYSSGGDRRALAGWIAGVLGTQNIEELPPAEDEIDVTVILGNDARDLIGR